MKSVALVFIAVILAPAQAPVVNATGQSISGRPIQPSQPVSFDCAVDGTVVNSVTGEPVPRARVGIIVPPAAGAGTIAEASGKWSFSNIACGPVELTVTRPGFFPSTKRPVNPLTLVSGSPIHDVKTELVPQSVFYGKVVDDQDDPVMGVQIQVLISRVVNGKAAFQPAGNGVTNDLGEYRVSGLQRGKYLLCAHGGAQTDLPGLLARQQTMTGVTCYPGPPVEGAANAMDVPAGREMKVDFMLNQVPAIHVRGTVSGLPEGRNFGLNLAPRGPAASLGNNASAPVRNGRFDFRVTPGPYVLTADYFENGRRLMTRVPVEVGSADIDNVAVALDGGFTVTGNVRIDSQTGAKNRPQVSMNLRALEPANATATIRWEADRTSFTFTDMVPGSYRLDVFSPPPYYVKSAALGGQDILDSEFSVSQAAGPLEIVLRDDGGSIEGDIVNANGQKIPGSVMAIRNGRPVTAPSSGHFKLQNLAPGDYQVYAWDEPSQVEYANPEWMRRYGGNGVAVTVAAGQTSQVKLTIQTVPQ